MRETAFGVHRFTRRLPALFALGAFAVFAVSLGQASDIGGEVAPPPCAYNASGGVVAGFPPQCTGLAGISVFSSPGSVLTNLSFGASAGTVAEPFRWDNAVSGSQSDLLFSGTLGPLLPLPADPQLQGNALGGRQFFSRMMSETLVNDSQNTWTGFYIELQLAVGTPSTNGDGLSFGQVGRNPQQLVILPNSNIFSTTDFESNLRDSILFAGGLVAPGQSVVLNFPISETIAPSDFFLVQQPVETTPEPAPFLLAVSGVALLVCRRRAATAGAEAETRERVAVPRILARR